MRALRTLSLLASLVLSVPGFAAPAPAPAAGNNPTTITRKEIRFDATVVSVNLKRRTVTLRNQEGKTIQVVAGDEARNLETLHAGDAVVAKYSQAVAMQLKKVQDEPYSTIERAVLRPPQGVKPQAFFAREISFVADVIGVDPFNNTVTLEGAAGHVFDITVNNPAEIAGVKTGDQLEGKLLQSLDILVTAEVPKHKAKK